MFMEQTVQEKRSRLRRIYGCDDLDNVKIVCDSKL